MLRLGLLLIVSRVVAQEDIFEACLPKSWKVDIRITANDAPLATNAWKVGDVRDCLDSFKMNIHEMSITLENLFFGESTVYSFTPIVRNTTASVQKNKCDLDVHDLQVDLQGELRKIYQEFVVAPAEKINLHSSKGDTSPQALHELLWQQTDKSALEFHCRLRDLFARLNDAHTLYAMSSLAMQILPVNFTLVPLPPGTEGQLRPFVITAGPADELQDALKIKSGVLPAGTAKEVKLINGVDPLLFLQHLADEGGTYLDQGSRLNSLLMKAGQLDGMTTPTLTGGLSSIIGFDSDIVPKGQETVDFTFTDGTSAKVDWIIALSPDLVVRQLTGVDPQYAYLEDMQITKAAWAQAREAECRSIPECNSTADDQEQVTRGPTMQAYQRLLGHLSDKTLAEAALLSAKRVVAVARQQESAAHLASAYDAVEDALQGTAHHPSTAKVVEARRAVENAPDGNAVGSLRKSLREELATTNRPVQACVGDAATVVYVGNDPAGNEWVTVTRVGDMMIYKLQSMGGAPVQKYMAEAMKAFATMADYANEHGLNKLLLDLISNGGGLVLLSDLLQSLILKDYDPTSLCNRYDKRISEYWRQWILSFGRGTNKALADQVASLKKMASKTSFRVVQWYAKYSLKYLKGLIDSSNKVLDAAFHCSTFGIITNPECNGKYLIDVTIIDTWEQQVHDATSVKKLISIMEDVLTNHEFIPSSLYAGSLDNGWFPFLGNEILYTEDQTSWKPFADMEGLLNSVEQQWGGVKANFSQIGIMGSCTISVASDLNLATLAGLFDTEDISSSKNHPFTDVAFVTDGLAGSAASALPSKLLASGYVTAFTYGGRGKPIDTSAFAGGNVLEYAGFWPLVAIAAELGMWMLPNSSWEQFSLRANASHIHNGTRSVIYPYAMPFKAASTRFNFNMMYLSELEMDGDKDSTTLPRQFYRQPAHKHYDIWPKFLKDSCSNPTGLISLYETIRSEDWWALRSAPVPGVNTTCIPDKDHEKCCIIHTNPMDDALIAIVRTIVAIAACCCIGCCGVGFAALYRRQQRAGRQDWEGTSMAARTTRSAFPNAAQQESVRVVHPQDGVTTMASDISLQERGGQQ